MGAVNTTYTFTPTDTITSTKMNNIIDETVMTSDAVLGGSGGSGGLDISSGKLSISANAINSSRLAANSVTSSNIVDGTIVNDDISPTAAIAGTKITASFGSQNITATGGIALSGTASSYTAANLTNISGVRTNFFSNQNLNGGVAVVTNHPMLLATNNTERMRISAAGDIGIGTSTPGAKLEIKGSTVDDVNPELKISGSAGHLSTYVSLDAGGYNPIVLDQDKAIIFTEGTTETGNLVIAPHSSSVGGVRITSSGNVGIKKASPSTALDVNGTVTATAFSGPLTGNASSATTAASCSGNSATATTAASCSGNSATATLATKASTLSQNGGNGTAMTFNWSGQVGQPTWLWGGNDGANHYVYNPANFSVNYANSSNYANSTEYASRAAEGPVNGSFTQSHTANVNKISVGGFGTNKGWGIYLQRAANENSSALHFARETGVTVGSIVLDTANTTNYNTTSDYRLKEDFKPIANPLDKLCSLNPLNFKWIDNDTRLDGFLAHEVKAVICNAVTGEKDDVDDNGNPIYQQIDQSKLIPIMVAAIQELSQKVAELEAK